MRLVGAAVVLLFIGAAAAQDAVPGEYLVKYRPGLAPLFALSRITRSLNIARVRADLATLRANPDVEWVEPNYRTRLAGVNDPMFSTQWHLAKINAANGWAFSTGHSDIVVAVLDSGVDLTNPDLTGKVIATRSFTTFAANDAIGHGTHVSGIVGARTNNGLGVASLGYNTSVIVGKVVDDRGNGTDATLVAGIEWAVDSGAKVINLSLSQQSPSLALRDAIDFAWSQGVIVVAAAGNFSGTAPTYPASYPNCIAVAATDQSDRRAGFSSYGPWVDVAAPGVSILSTFPRGTRVMNGTSFAAPQVSALAALLWARGASSQWAVRSALTTSGSPTTGFGTYPVLRIDARKALMRMP